MEFIWVPAPMSNSRPAPEMLIKKKMAAQIIPSLFYMFHVGPPLSDTFFLNIHMIRLQSLQMLIVANNAMIYTNSLLMTFFCC